MRLLSLLSELSLLENNSLLSAMLFSKDLYESSLEGFSYAK